MLNNLNLIGKKNHSLAIIFLIIVSFAIYANTLGNQFIGFDDYYLIINNEFIKNLSNIGNLFPSLDFDRTLINYSRPVALVSYMIDFAVWGYNPLGYHLTNVIMHVIATVLAYCLIQIMFGEWQLSFAAALLFALHPAHTENINHLGFRSDIIAFNLILIAFIAFIRSKTAGNLPKLGLLLTSYLTATLALFAKESAIIYPLLFLSYEWIAKKPAISKKYVKEYLAYLPFIALFVFYWIKRASVFNYQSLLFGGIDSSSGGLIFKTVEQKIAYIAHAGFFYLKLLLMPINLMADYLYSDAVAGLYTFNGAAFAKLSLLVALFFLAIIIRKKHPAASFGILFFFISFIPFSGIFPIANQLAERYLYLPSLGFVLVLAYVLYFLTKSNPKIFYVLLAVMAISYGYLTFIRNKDWRNNEAFWQKSYEANPNSPRTMNNMGLVYFLDNKIDEAIKLLEQALTYPQDNTGTHFNLAKIYLLVCRDKEAIEILKKALKENDKEPWTYWLLALAYRFDGKPDLEKENEEKARRLDPLLKLHYLQNNIMERRSC